MDLQRANIFICSVIFNLFFYTLTCSNEQSGFVSDNRLIDNVESLNCVRKGMFWIGLGFHLREPIHHSVSP